MKEKTESSSRHLIRTDGGKSKSNAIEIPSISLPKGGGAIKGIDEKFSVNAVNGTASFSVPLPVSPARGISPSLSISYNSGGGNGIFGPGWNLLLPSIKRKTDKGLPQYIDDADTFLFSEAEDLVPAYKKNNDGTFAIDDHGDYIIDEKDAADANFIIRYYRPRIEGLFARIERWRHKNTGEIKWRMKTKENLTTLFGWNAGARISDPEDDTKIFQWLPEFTFDDKGNCFQYIYKKEDEAGFDPSFLHHKNRLKYGQITYTNAYLEKVVYGNKTPFFADDRWPAENDYLFSTVLDYGEYNSASPYDRTRSWDFRADAFSDYKAGFEIRTTRLCKRVFLFHHFDGVGEYEGLVRSLNINYDTSTEADFSFLRSFTTCGYIKKPDGSYSFKNMPPAEFGYQRHEWNKEVRSITTENILHAPAGLDERLYQFVDLYNEGLSGMLTEQGGEWYYKQNSGNGEFESAKLVAEKPSFQGLTSALHLADLDADGTKQLVSYKEEHPGYFELDDENKWNEFRVFNSLPTIDQGDANVRMLDLDGDGKPELVVTEENVLTWYPSAGRSGFSEAKKTAKSFDEEEGPHIVFADTTQSIFLADMSGDGMTDILRIRNGEVCYWPNKGYGKFGAKVAFDNAPLFDHSDHFNPSYLRLADIDGSGTTDIIYLGKNKFTCWKNLSGNRFDTTPFEIDAFPAIDNNAKISVADILGNGVACIVWSGSLEKDAHAPLRYIDLMNGKKPHIMTAYRNNLGKEVSMEYQPSTKYYLDDKKAGKPWVTKLHFPVHCVSRTITEDKITGHRFVSEYKYHHGYYDHAEREFRGFGMVEKTDAETFDHWVKTGATNLAEQPLHQEPVVSKTWNHTGAFSGKERILNQFENDYWYHEMDRAGYSVTHHEKDLPDARLVTASNLPASVVEYLSVEEWQQAVRACKGITLRTEVFAKDAAGLGNTEEAKRKELIPYNVATHNCMIELLQPKGKNKYAVFVVKESEAVTYSYERDPGDPRIAHTLNLKLDEYGNLLQSASVVYPRMVADTSLPEATREEQEKTVIIFTDNYFTNDVINDETYYLRLPSEVKTYELKGVEKSSDYYAVSDFENILHSCDIVFYHEISKSLREGVAQKRLIEHTRSCYYSNDLKNPLPLHQLGSPAIPYESYQLAYTPELLDDIYQGKVTPALLEEGRFTHSEADNNWWIRSGTTQLLRDGESLANAYARFFTPLAFKDPYGAITKIKYYGSYFLFIEETEDAIGNRSGVEQFNFRTLAPQMMFDANRNLTAVISDELGMVKALAVMGKGDEGDELTALNEVTTEEELMAVHQLMNAADSVQMHGAGKNLLQRATTRFVYDLGSYLRSGKPAVVAAITREEHFPVNNDSPVQVAFEYSNGMGEVVMKKVQAGPGLAKQVLVHADDTISIREVDTSDADPELLRWIGNGRTIKNNKGNPVKQYEPYFSVTHHYEDHKELVETGLTPVMYYDAAGRVVKTEMPDGTFSKVEFNSWEQKTYDQNDTVGETVWYAKRTDATRADFISDIKEQQAAAKTYVHRNTPARQHFDTTGRPILSIDHNKNTETEADEFYGTGLLIDVEGNLRSVTDARHNLVMQYKYDMLGNKVFQHSMDAGKRWLLINIAGKPLRTWDERDFEIQHFYDILQRSVYTKVMGGEGTPLDHVFDRTVYGDDLLRADRSNERVLQSANLIGQVFKHYDTGGLVETPAYDFKGKPVRTTRTLFSKYKEVANWIDDNLERDLEDQPFTFITDVDALGRIKRQVAPDGSIITPSYNEGGLLNGESVWHPQTNETTVYIKDIDYNVKSQREKIIYGNDVTTRFYYDDETLRLKRLYSYKRNGDPLQDWHYNYDAVGNITHIEDRNAPLTFFDNHFTSAVSEYTYDALYRLVAATGRENDSALSFDGEDNWNDRYFMQQMNPGDSMAIRNYTERYTYDEVGNITNMHHRAIGNNWSRAYEYATHNNRLLTTSIGGTTYRYQHHPLHGYIETMPQLQEMGWNFKEELVKTIRQRRYDGGIPETTYCQYDGSGQRIRKITENQAAPGAVITKKEERIYVSGYELYKKHSDSDAGLERVSLSLIDQGNRFVIVEMRNEINDGTEQHLVRYQLHNHLGSAALESDQQARIISYEEYHPFGTTAYQAKNRMIRSAHKRYRYTGMERDEESGLEYHSARYYLPWLGRWLSSDPIGIEDGVNVFSYVNNKPTKMKDSTGKWGEEGHYWTVFLMAMAAGFNETVANRMAFFAYMPDQVFELDATSVQINYLRLFVNNGDPSAQQESHRDIVQVGGHSLTGRLHSDERPFRENITRSLEPGSLLHGLALHAYGDVFSHRQLPDSNIDNRDSNRQYPTGFGHLPDEGRPDNINENPTAFSEYATGLFRILSSQASLARAQGFQITNQNVSASDIQTWVRDLTSMSDQGQRIAYFRRLLTERFHVQNIQGIGNATNPDGRRIGGRYTVPDRFDTFRSLNGPRLPNVSNLDGVFRFYSLITSLPTNTPFPVWGQVQPTAPQQPAPSVRRHARQPGPHRHSRQNMMIDTNCTVPSMRRF